MQFVDKERISQYIYNYEQEARNVGGENKILKNHNYYKESISIYKIIHRTYTFFMVK